MNSPDRWSEPEATYPQGQAVEDAIRLAVRPEPVLTVSQWADRYRVLTTKLAAEAGPYRTERVPFLRDVMDALSPGNPARKVVFMKGAQVGATEAGNNWLGYTMHWSPAPVMAVWPTVDFAKRMSKQRVGPLIEDCPDLRDLIGAARSRDASNTVLEKAFPGGILIITGANSGVGLRGMPARYAFLDEVDGYPSDVDGEGDPIALVANRTTSFGRKAKLFIVSTPTVHGESRIEREFEASDQRRYFVPCPDCGERQWLKFERLTWDRGHPETVRYACEHCGSLFEEHHKTRFMSPEAGAEWRPTAEAKDPGCVGFHISALYSPLGWMSWEDIAREWEAAQGHPEKLKTFKNTRLGETWFEQGDSVAWERIYERRETWKPGTLPAGVTLLIGAVDVQASPARLELNIWGFGEELESWAIEHSVHPGPADDPKTWKPIEEALERSWLHASGVELKLDLLAVDTGDQTTAVYGWIALQDQARVLAMKGRAGYEINAPVAVPTYVALGRKKKAIALRTVTGDVFKAELYRFVGRARPTDEEIAESGYPPGWVHVPDFLDAEWCRQLVAERRIRTKTGRYEWKKEHPRNEVLDCRVYARAALWTMGVAGWRPKRWESVREKRGLARLSQTGPAAEVEITADEAPAAPAPAHSAATGIPGLSARQADAPAAPPAGKYARFGRWADRFNNE